MYKCNITGKLFDLEDSEKERELAIRYGYNSRFRAICYVLSKTLFREVRVLEELKQSKKIKGLGMADGLWSTILKEKFDYINTFNNADPKLDIYNSDHVGSYKNLDFIISSDVFEHIVPFPGIQIAFNNILKMLRKGGCFIFSVPYVNEGEHVEHFPNLYDYKLETDENYKHILYNKTKDDKLEIFSDLCFHGEPCIETLEMRLFSKKSVSDFLQKSGFVNINFHTITEDMNAYGIFWSKDNAKNSCSLIISATKPFR
jgi:SAM-dependent methyltransferase